MPEIPIYQIDAFCGHATLAAGAVIVELLEPGRAEVAFDTRSGELVLTGGAVLVLEGRIRF